MLKQYITPVLASMPLFFGTFEKDVEVIEVKEEIVEEVVEEVVSNYIEVEATFYTAFCPTGCIGITKTGDNVKNTIYANGHRVIAVDPKVIPLRSVMLVELEDGESFTAIASDTGSAIKGLKIDVLVKDRSYAYQKGRQKAKITMMRDIHE